MIEFEGFDRAAFLQDYWQQKPLLLRNALPLENPISPEELAGIALEDGIDARLIDYRDENWECRQTPLDESSFASEEPWTLLVQAVDHYVPDVAALRSAVRFIPDWRFDDIMVSYATDGGGVGPHYDNYDVFLWQGMGQRRWRLGQRCDSNTPLQANPQLRLLSEFKTQQDFLLEPGDVLYVPPGVAHWGEAQGSCMTYSLGFRAPSIPKLLSHYTDEALSLLDAEHHYRDHTQDTGRAQSLDSVAAGEISDSAIDTAKRQLQAALDALELSPQWFGEAVTEPRGDVLQPDEHEPLPSQVHLDPQARLAWHQNAKELSVFANGEQLPADSTLRPLLIDLCEGRSIHLTGDISAADPLLTHLWYAGLLQDSNDL